MKIEINVSEKNEGTQAPWWVILNPRQNMTCNVHSLANQITGPFFSREEAEIYLHNHRHNYNKRAVVYCMSGWNAIEYNSVWSKAEKNHMKGEK